jgi:Protein of unknown function (DUF2905)
MPDNGKPNNGLSSAERRTSDGKRWTLDLEPMFDSLARMLIVLGIVLALLGGVLLLVGQMPFLGRLPGDIVIRRQNWSLYFPLTTSIVISVLLTLLFSLFSRR